MSSSNNNNKLCCECGKEVMKGEGVGIIGGKTAHLKECFDIYREKEKDKLFNNNNNTNNNKMVSSNNHKYKK